MFNKMISFHRRSSTLLCAASLLLAVGGCSQKPESDAADTVANSANESVVQNSAATLRKISNGSVEGLIQTNGSYAWLGIPYAKPPVDTLRWQPPQPVENWSETFSATNNIQPCPQFPSVLSAGIDDADGDGIVGSEDCLYLSVYAPAGSTADDNLPVMYWIFGGGNNSGYAGDYDGGFIAQQQNVVVVTVNYRLGPLGWFIHPAILPEGAQGAAASGNWSTLDTIAGLQWVQKNISAFGGNPNNVTIFGESAGGGNVLTLVSSPMAKDLFHKAIVESGGVGSVSMSSGTNYRDAEAPGHVHSSMEIINKLLVARGTASDREQAKKIQDGMTNKEIYDFLYGLSPAEFLKIYNPEGSRNYPAPKKFQDGTVLPTMDFFEQVASGNYNQVPLITGTNRDERRIYMYRDPKWVDVIKNDPEEYKRMAKYPSDIWKLSAVDNIARAMTAVQSAAVFAYRFDWDEQKVHNGLDMSVAVGASHATEMAFVFGDWDVGFVPKEMLYDPKTIPGRDKLSSAMMSYWAKFAYSGNPGKGRSGDQVEWQSWQSGNDKPKMIIFDSENDGGIRMSNFEMTAESLKAEFMQTSFSGDENRCYIYRTTFTPLGLFDDEEYKSLVEGGCK